MASETYPHFYEKFLKWVQSRKYDVPTDHPYWGVKVREFKFFNLVFPQEWKAPLMKDLNKWVKKDKRVDKMKRSIPMKYAMKKMNMEPVYANDAIKEYGKSTTEECGNPQFWTYLHYLGILEDKKAKNHRVLPDGTEKI